MYERRRLMLGGKKMLPIYKSGNTRFENCTEYGIDEKALNGFSSDVSISFNADHLLYCHDGSGFSGTASAFLYIKTDFTDYEKIVVDFEGSTTYQYDPEIEFHLAYSPTLGTNGYGALGTYAHQKLKDYGITCKDVTQKGQTMSRRTVEYDISTVTGENYIIIAGSIYNNFKIYQIHLE